MLRAVHLLRFHSARTSSSCVVGAAFVARVMLHHPSFIRGLLVVAAYQTSYKCFNRPVKSNRLLLVARIIQLGAVWRSFARFRHVYKCHHAQFGAVV